MATITVKNIPDELYNRIIGSAPVTLIKERTYEILYTAQAALVTSGTATLEAATFPLDRYYLQ